MSVYLERKREQEGKQVGDTGVDAAFREAAQTEPDPLHGVTVHIVGELKRRKSTLLKEKREK